MIKQHHKKIIKTMFCLFAIFSCVIKVNATDCTYVEKAKLNQLASKVKTTYEIIEEEELEEFIDPDTDSISMLEIINTTFKISIYNITEDIYIIQHNGLTDEKTSIFNTATNNGVYTFTTSDTENIIKYTYQIYSNLNNCSGELLKTSSFTKPKMNLYAQYRMCQGLEEVPYCKSFITEEMKVSESELEEKLTEYLSNTKVTSPQNEEEKFKEIIQDNYIYIIIGVGIVVGTLIVTIVIVKRSAV